MATSTDDGGVAAPDGVRNGVPRALVASMMALPFACPCGLEPHSQKDDVHLEGLGRCLRDDRGHLGLRA